MNSVRKFCLLCDQVRAQHPVLYQDKTRAGRRHDVANRRRIVKYWLTDYSGTPLFK